MSLARLSQRGRGNTVAIGALKDQVTIQQRATKNSYGQQSGSWSPVVQLFAKVEHVQGRQDVNLVEYAAETTDLITVPFVAGIEPRMRVVYVDAAGKTHNYEILWPQNVEERGFFLLLLVKEIFDAS